MMKSDPTFPCMRDVVQLTADGIQFRDHGWRTLTRLSDEEWKRCTDNTDPRTCIAEILQLFIKKNKLGFGILGNLLWKQWCDNESDELIFRYVPVRNGAASRKRWCRQASHSDGALLARCAEGRDVLPERLIVVASRMLGVPEEVLLKRASKASENLRLHLGVRAVQVELTPAEQELYERIAPIIGQLPLRQRLAPAEALELYRRMQAIS